MLLNQKIDIIWDGVYIYIYIDDDDDDDESINCGESDRMIQICGKLDKSNP